MYSQSEGKQDEREALPLARLVSHTALVSGLLSACISHVVEWKPFRVLQGGQSTDKSRTGYIKYKA